MTIIDKTYRVFDGFLFFNFDERKSNHQKNILLRIFIQPWFDQDFEFWMVIMIRKTITKTKQNKQKQKTFWIFSRGKKIDFEKFQKMVLSCMPWRLLHMTPIIIIEKHWIFNKQKTNRTQSNFNDDDDDKQQQTKDESSNSFHQNCNFYYSVTVRRNQREKRRETITKLISQGKIKEYNLSKTRNVEQQMFY